MSDSNLKSLFDDISIKTTYFIKFLILGFLLVPITIKSSFAQVPGDACTAGEVDVYRYVNPMEAVK